MNCDPCNILPAGLLDEIDGIWLKLTGRGLRPGDVVKLENWLAEGVSRDAVIYGIRRTFERFRPRYAGDRIKHLQYCHDEIFEYELRLRRAGF
ncbi:MAG: hypothetical protein KGJ13_06065 [Patescibacteria group bacterium]|nr:hypothetical protein [Patescibacteria group bacterium]